VAVLAGAAVASIQIHAALAAKRAPSEYDELNNTPLLFYLAKGAPNACGPGCSEWIAAEGYFDAGAPERLRAVLARAGNRNLPIYLQSPGGFIDEAMVIGRFLREHQMTAGVARTIPDACAARDVKACRAAKRSGQILNARLVGISAGCNSACVYALMGAATRVAPPQSRVGIHRMFMFEANRSPESTSGLSRVYAAAPLVSRLGEYAQVMGVNPELVWTAETINPDKIRILSGPEMRRWKLAAPKL